MKYTTHVIIWHKATSASPPACQQCTSANLCTAKAAGLLACQQCLSPRHQYKHIGTEIVLGCGRGQVAHYKWFCDINVLWYVYHGSSTCTTLCVHNSVVAACYPGLAKLVWHSLHPGCPIFLPSHSLPQFSRLAASPANRYCCCCAMSTTGNCILAMKFLLSGSEYNGTLVNSGTRSCVCVGTQAKAMGFIGLLMGESDVSCLSLLPSNAAPWSDRFDSTRCGAPCITCQNGEAMVSMHPWELVVHHAYSKQSASRRYL